MITDVINLLKTSDFYGCSESIEIAKGKYELPTTIKKGFKQLKRELKWQRRT